MNTTNNLEVKWGEHRLCHGVSGDELVIMSIEKLVLDTLVEHLGMPNGGIQKYMNLRTDLHCDSIDDIEILMSLEYELQVGLHMLDDRISSPYFTVHDLIENVKTIVGETQTCHTS